MGHLALLSPPREGASPLEFRFGTSLGTTCDKNHLERQIRRTRRERRSGACMGRAAARALRLEKSGK
jgi:hypothetical protein